MQTSNMVHGKKIYLKMHFLSKNVKAFSPIIDSVRIFGLLPLFKIYKNGARQLKSKKWDMAIQFPIAFVISVLTLNFIKSISNKEYSTNDISEGLRFFFASSMLVIIIFFICKSFTTRKAILKLFYHLADVDVSLRQLTIEVDYKATLAKNLLHCLYTIIWIIVQSYTWANVLLPFDYIFERICVCFCIVLKFLALLLFISILHCVECRLKLLNNHLRSYYKDGRIKTVFSDKFAENLFIICSNHNKLCDIVRGLNAAFSMKLFFCIILTVMFTMHSYYILYYGFTRNVTTIEKTAVIFIANFITCMYVYILLGICTRTIKQADKTADNLHKMRNVVLFKEFEFYVQNYSLRLMFQKFTFEAAGGFFIIDNTFIYKTYIVLITYFVIFIQYDQQNH